VMKPYRYMAFPDKVRKGRTHLVLALHKEGKPMSDIQKITGCTAKSVKTWVDHYDASISSDKKPNDFFALKMNVQDLCYFYQVLANYK